MKAQTLDAGQAVSMDNFMGSVGRLLIALAANEDAYHDTPPDVAEAATDLAALIEEMQIVDWWQQR